MYVHVCICVHMYVCNVWEPFCVSRYSSTHLPHPPGAEEAEILKML